MNKVGETVIIGQDDEGHNIYQEVYEDDKDKFIFFIRFLGGDGLKRAANVVLGV